MAVVIRLLGLPFVAGPPDIRHFFKGLTIPDGGVHIIGGEIGEAFIIFATDEDARRAISRSGGLIKDSFVELFLSSKAEMQKTIEMKKTDRTGRERPGSGGAGAGSLSNFGGTIKEEVSDSGYQDAEFHTNGDDLKPRRTRPARAKNPYLFLRGLPYLVNEDDVRVFFAGLCVDGVIFLKHHDGRNNGDAIVKFASCIDASGGLKCHRSFMGSRFIEVMQSSDQQWTQFGGKVDEVPSEEHSPPRGIDRRLRKRSHSRSPRRTRSRSPVGNYVHLKNLSLSITKRDIRNFFRDADLSNEQITFLYKEDKRTRYALVMFKTLKDFYSALALHKTVVQYRPVHIDPISKKRMQKLMEYYETKKPGSVEKERPGHVSQKYSQEGYSGQKVCIYIRNFPFDVTKVEVQKFFADFALSEDDIYLLYDDKGVGLGEALVKFISEEEAMKAERLNRRRFLGTEVLLRLISEAQMQEFGINFSLKSNEKMQDSSESHDRDDHSHSFDSKEPPVYSVSPSENFRHQLEDTRKPDNFKPPQGDFRQPDRRPPEDFRHSPEDFRRPPEDFRHSSEDFRRPREEHYRRPPEDFRRPPEDNFRRPPEDNFRRPPEDNFRRPPEDNFRRPPEDNFRRPPEDNFRRPPEDNFKHPREEDWRRPPEEDWRRPIKEDFRRPPKEDWRQPPEGDFRRPSDEDWRRPPDEDFRRPPEEDFRRPPEEDFRQRPEEDFRHSPEEDFRRSPQEHFRRPPQDHFRRPHQDHFRRPSQEHFRRPPQEHFRRPPQEHFRRPHQEHFRRPHQEHFRRPHQEHFRRPREEDFRHPPDEDFRGPSDEDFRHPPDEDFRSPREEDFRCASDEDFRQLPEEDLRGGALEEDPRLADNFRPPGEEFRSPPDDFRGHRPFVNFGRPEGGKFDFGKRNMGGFPEGRFMPDPKLNCGSDRVTPIKIMNLPFKANVNEILDFFHGYKVIPDSVSIQYNEKGLPIGEAIVTMINYNEAMAAIKDLNDRPVGPRKVKLILL
ncbi:PREDICTED: RNA-binding protein 12B [Chrysochloris asiatica]|uniref:RNA-binding protein 12B n=1 Tax=Chrysochloris asiatica TaxID=185453 RepID=A0A9B0T5B0_CHRAS|nr:PREDICTED: RNA-binding protein 12B [Chrysochloris asiatica]